MMKVWIFHDYDSGGITVYRSKERAAADIEENVKFFKEHGLTYTLDVDYELFETDFID